VDTAQEMQEVMKEIVRQIQSSDFMLSENAYKELKELDIKKYFSGEIIPGIELKAQYKNHVIDVLGYKIDTDKITKVLKEYFGEFGREEIQIKQLLNFYEWGRKYRLILTPMEELAWDKKRDWASIVFYEEVKKHKENKEKVPKDFWESFENFKRNYYNKKGQPFYIDRAKFYPLLKDIIDIIHKSGGLAFVAHIYEYSWMENKLDELNYIVKEFNIDGVECYYNSFLENETKGLIEFCNKNKLFISGGSDYHGTNRPEIKIGVGKNDLMIPEDVIYGWWN